MGEGTDAAGTPAAAAVGAPTKSAPAVGARSSSPAEPEVEFVQTELPPAGIDGADPDPDYTATKLRKSSFKDTLGLGEKEIEFSDAVSNDGNGDSEKMDYANLYVSSAGEQANAAPPPTAARDSIGNVIPEDVVYADSERSRSRSLGLGVPAGLLLAPVKSSASSAPTDEHVRKRRRESEDDPRSDAHAGAAAASSSSTSKKQAVADTDPDVEAMPNASAPASASAPVPPDEDMPRKSPKLGGVPVGEFETPVSDLDNSSDGGGGGSARALESGDQGMKRRKLLLEHETPHNVFAKRSSYPVFQQRDYAGNASASPPLNAASPGGAAVPQEAPLAPAPDDERDIIREEQYRGEEPTFFFAGLSKLNAARTSSSAEESASQRVRAGQAAPPPPTKSPAVAQKSSLTGMFERAANLLWSGGRKRKSSFKVPSLIGTGDPLSPEVPGGADGGAASSSAPVGSRPSVSCVSSGSVVFPDHEVEAADEKSKSKGEAEASSGAPRPGGGTSSSPSSAPAVAAAAEQSARPADANDVEKHPTAALEPGTSSSSAVLADEKNLRLSEVSAQSHQSGALSARSFSLRERDDGPAASVASKASEVSRRPSGNAVGPAPAGTSSKRARSADQEFALDTHENKLHKAEVPSEAVGDQPRDVEQEIVRASSSGTSALPADKMKSSTPSKSNAVWSAASPKNAKPPSPLFGLSEDQNSKKRPPPQPAENEAPPPANLGTKTLQVQKPSVTDAAAPALALVPGAGSASSSASSSSSSCGPAPVLPPAPARPALSASSKQAQQNSFEPAAPARTSSNATGYKDVSFKRRKSIRDHKSRSMAGYDSSGTAADGGVQDHSTAQQPFESCDDCTALTHLDETSILQNLRLRYEKSQIYTSAAKVLLAVNPLAKSPAINDLYTTDRKKAYQEQMSSIHRGIRTVKETRPSCVPLKLAPHPYGMADAAYRQMLHDQQPQIVIISGVSGSGKTETAKITMGYLAYRSRSHEVEALEMAEKMLDCNPVLESFGNAATVRNCNSSRFGKYNALLFNVVGHLHSAEIRTFLLESSRVTNYASSERSYHVFYELLAAGGFGHGEFLSKRGIRWETSSYRIAREEDIGRGSPHCVFRRDDAANFKLLEQGLRGVKIDVSAVFEVLCGLIHLGEIDIISEEQNLASHALRLGNEENLDWAAKILGLDVSKLREVLTTKWVVIAGRDAYQVSRTQPQAIGLLHSLSKYLYRKLFDFIVAKVNVSLNRSSPPPPLSEPVQHPCQTQNKAESHQQHISPQVIGILDIYGFEQLEVNSFEQLCINLANEHLQQFFVDNVLRGEQELYRNEGLKWTAVTVPDCRACVTAITDCFKTLDDACFRVGRMAQKEVTAVTFTQSVHDKFKTAEKARNHGIVKEPKRGRGVAEKDSILRSEGFVVTHFAGDITYHTSGWLEKNNSRLESELEKLVGSSSSPVVLEFCAPFLGGAAAADASRASSGSSVAGSPDEPAGRSAVAAPTNFPKRPLARRGSSATLASFDSVSKKYLTDLSKLLQTLQEANLHYVRCFCPNAAQEPNLFDKSVVLNQMRESGTFQLVDIMHRGYPHRCDYKVLAKKFQSSLPEEYQQYDARTFIDLLMLAYDVPKCDYVMGISKLFLKSGKLAILQKLLAENASSEMSQDLRRYFTRKKQKRCFHAVRFCIFLKKFTRKCRQENLAHGLFVAARTFVRIARWHKRAQRRLAVADKQRQFARTVLLIAKLRAFVKKRLERIRIRERRLHILYRWSNFYVFNLRYIRRWRAEKERERKALAEQNVKFFAQICVIKLRLRQAVKGARDRIRRRAARRNIDALARFCLIKVQFSRKLRFLRLTKAEQERARKERAIETVRTFVQICKLQLKLRRLAAEARDRVRRRATERNLELVAGYVRMTVVVRRALRRRMRRKQAAQRAQEHWHTVFRHAVLPSIGIRWLNGKIKAFKLAKRAADAADGINLLVRHTNNVVRLKRAIARARRSLKTHHHLKTFGQHVMLCMALRRYLVNWRADRDKAKRVLLAQARLKTFAQHVVLCKAMLLYVRHWKAEKQRRKSIRAHAHLDTFARHAILSIALRRYIRNRRTSKNLISEAQERQAHERAKKQQRTEHLLTSWARGCLLAVHFRSFVHARRRLGARRIFAFLDKSAKTQRRRTALLSVLDAHRRKRRLGRMTLPKFDDIVCKLICLKRLIRRWKRRKDEQRKRKVRTKGLLDQFVRGVFVAIRLRRWLHAMQERLVLKQVDHHLARRENKQRLCTIVCGLVLLKRAVRQWALRKRRRKSVSVLLGKLCEAVRIIRSLKRWIRSFRASKNGNGTRNTRNAVAAAPAGGFAASSSLRIDFPEDDHQAAMLQQPCLFSTDLSDLSGCSIAARASGAVNNANASLVLVAPPPTLASAASGTTDLVQAEAAMATASSAAGGTIANNQSAISPEDLQHLMTRMQMLEQEVQSLGGEVRRSRSSRQLARSSTQALVIAGEEGEQEKLLPSSSSRVSENVARQGANGLMMVDAGAVDVVGGVEVDGVMHADGPGRDAALERTRTGGNIDVAMGERGLAGLEAGLEAMLKGIRGRGGPSPSGAAAGASATASSSSPAVDVEMHQGPRESLNGRQRLVAQSPSDFLHINCVEQCGAAGSPPVQGVSELHAAQNGSSAASSSLGSKATKHLHFPSSSKKSKSNSKKSSPKADSGTRSKRSSSGLLGVNFGHDSASKRIAANLAADNHQAGDTVAHSPVGPEGQHLHNYSDEAGEAEGDRDDMSAQHQQHLIVHADSSLVTGHAHGAFNFPEDLAEFEKQIQEASDDDSEDHREAEEEMNAGKIDAKLAAEKKYIKGNSFGSATLQQHMQRQKERRGAKSVPGIGRH